MAGNKKFVFAWNYETDALHVKCIHFSGSVAEQIFTKEFLEDCTADKWYKILDAMPDHAAQIAMLCLPRIRQLWLLGTGGNAEKIGYNLKTNTFNVWLSQGFIVKLPAILFEDEHYAHIDMLFSWLAVNYKSLKNISVYHWSADKDVYYEIGFDWDIAQQASDPYTATQALADMNQAMTPQQGFVHMQNQLDQLQQAMLQNQNQQAVGLLQGMAGQLGQGLGQLGGVGGSLFGQGKKTALQQQQMVQAQMNSLYANKPALFPKELHVYDLGEGMLVPCEMVHDLAHMFKTPEPKWTAQYMDDFYGEGVAEKITKKAKHAMLYGLGLKHIKDEMILFPGKVMMLDDPPQVEVVPSPYLTDEDAWFLHDPEDFVMMSEEKFNEAISKITGVSTMQQGKPSVKIPKKPKQITKQTLDYFHKLLNTPKDPWHF